MLRRGHVIFLTMTSLLMLGVVMVHSAGLEVGADTPVTMRSILLGKYALLAAGALVAAFVAARIPVDALYRLRGSNSPVPWLAVGSIALLVAVLVPAIGTESHASRRWIDLGPVNFQPSEIAKWSVPIVLAWHAARRAGAMHRFGTGFAVPMAYLGLVCALIAVEDLGTAVLVAGVGTIVLLAGGMRFAWLLLGAPVAAIGLAAAILHPEYGYRLVRLRTFLDPYADPSDAGYHVVQSLAAVNGGGFVGRGLGGGVQKFGYLPEDTSDFIFAIVCEELGIAGALAVLVLLGALVLATLAVARAARRPFARLVALGVGTTIAGQAIINLFVVTAMAPTKGIALPLVSKGGTGWLLTAAALGLVIAIDRQAVRTELAEADAEHDARPVDDGEPIAGELACAAS